MRIVFILLTAALIPVLATQTPTLRPGQYELISEFSIAGRTGGLPVRKDQHCYTTQELQDLARSVARSNAKQNCTVLDSKTIGSTTTFTTECVSPDGSRLAASGEVNVTSQDAYRVVVTMRRPTSPDGTTIAINARRIGDCAK